MRIEQCLGKRRFQHFNFERVVGCLSKRFKGGLLPNSVSVFHTCASIHARTFCRTHKSINKESSQS